jgi:hypothetical protein
VGGVVHKSLWHWLGAMSCQMRVDYKLYDKNGVFWPHDLTGYTHEDLIKLQKTIAQSNDLLK